MPFYEYECSNCRFYVEVLQKISEQPLKKCPSCGKNALKKLVSAPVFRLKGSGWYETDFKSDQEGKRNLAAADKEETTPDKKDAKSADDSKTEAKSEPKPDTKPEAKTATAAEGKRESGKQRKPAAKAKSGKRPVAKPKAAVKRRRGR